MSPHNNFNSPIHPLYFSSLYWPLTVYLFRTSALKILLEEHLAEQQDALVPRVSVQDVGLGTAFGRVSQVAGATQDGEFGV